MPRFSIIIPAYNSAGYIKKALDSVKQQTYTDYELIVVCDSCKDDTYDIAKEYTDRVYKVDYGNDGLARSKGLDVAIGQWVLFIDDDDWWLHEYVLWQLNDKLNEIPVDTDVLCFSFIFKGKQYANTRDKCGNYWIAVWNKCWKRVTIGNTRFPNVPRSSDQYFHKEMFKKNLKIYEWDMPMYYYNYLRIGSQTEIYQTTKSSKPTVQVAAPPILTPAQIAEASKLAELERKRKQKHKEIPKYMIHTCNDRLWYVNDFLVPSMKAQGIPEKNITVFRDRHNLGNLRACIASFNQLPDDDTGTWHLQDDVVISRWFRERTTQYDDGLVCGFASKYCEHNPPGVVNPDNIWYSFPCIRMPNLLAHQFVNWFNQVAVKEPKYRTWIEQNKFDDEFFKIFVQTTYPGLRLRNVSPNLVDHIDYMLGGSTVRSRTGECRSIFWNEENVIKELEYKLQQAGKR